MESKQGAVDWLIKLYQQTGKIDIFDLEVAKEIEKERIIPLFVDPKVNDPMWFPKAKNNELTEDFIEGYSQAVYQIRLLISSLQEEPTGEKIRTYTEFMLKELYNSRDNQNK
jgi:hypothetical protein